MKYGAIRGLDSPFSRVILGTDSLFKTEVAFSALDAAVELGINTVDTARIYGSEETVGRWMKSRQRRSDVSIITKGGLPGPPTATILGQECEASLKALSIDCIDCYLVHYDNASIDLGEMLTALDGLRRAGKIRSFGLSNFQFARVQDFVQICSERSIAGPSAISAHHSLLSWTSPMWPNAQSLAEPEMCSVRAWYAANDYGVLAYSPLARGFFKSKAMHTTVSPHFDCPLNHE